MKQRLGLLKTFVKDPLLQSGSIVRIFSRKPVESKLNPDASYIEDVWHFVATSKSNKTLRVRGLTKMAIPSCSLRKKA